MKTRPWLGVVTAILVAALIGIALGRFKRLGDR
jgi:hypothetical protein